MGWAGSRRWYDAEFIKDAVPLNEYNAFDAAYPVVLTSQAFAAAAQKDANTMKSAVKLVLKHADQIDNAAQQYGWW